MNPYTSQQGNFFTNAMRAISSNGLYLFLFLLLLSITLRLPSLFVPILDPDEAIFANAGRAILNGGAIYRDFIDHKPPLIYFLYASMLTIINDMRFVHAVTAAWVALTGFTLFYILKRTYDQKTALIGAICCTAFSSVLSLASTTEVLMNLPIVAAVFFSFRKWPSSALNIFFSGLFICAAALIKHQAAFVGLPILFLALAHAPKNKIAAITCSFFLGVVAALVPWLLLIVSQNTFAETWRWAFLANIGYLATVSNNTWALELITQLGLAVLFTHGVLWWASFTHVSSWIKEKGYLLQDDEQKTVAFGILWLVVSILAVSMGLRFYRHYFIQLTPVLCFLAAPVIAYYLDRTHSHKTWMRNLIIAMLLLPIITMMIFFTTKSSFKKYYHQFPEVEKVARVIQENSTASDKIFVWGNYAGISYFANRQDVSPFAQMATALGNFDSCRFPVSFDVASLRLNSRYDEVVAAIKTQRPKIIVDLQNAPFRCWEQFDLRKFPEIYYLINLNYKKLTDVNGIPIWVLK